MSARVPREHGAAPRSILITGCSSGIGRCAAEALKERGYRVFATARKQSDVEALAGDGFEAARLDLDDPQSIAEGAAQVLEKTGGTLDALFNNAGYGQYGALEDVPRASLRRQFETNLFGLHELTTHVLPAMRRQGHGRIVQNSSLLGYLAMPLCGAYVASKHALEGWSDTLRLELAGTGIHVSLIEPGPTQTAFAQSSLLHLEDTATGAGAPQYRSLRERLRADQQSRLARQPPETVVRCLLHALESKRPKTRYRITLSATALWYMKRWLTTRLLDRALLTASR